MLCCNKSKIRLKMNKTVKVVVTKSAVSFILVVYLELLFHS